MAGLPAALAPLAARDQFVTWIAVPHATKAGKWTKLPCAPASGAVVDAHNPAHWTNAETARAVAQPAPNGGVGFVFTVDDPWFFLDIDNCLLPDGTWSALAQELCALFAGAAVEVSHSGKGLHIFGRYSGKLPPHGTKNTALGLEFYTSGRFVALTGYEARGDVDHDCTAILAAWLAFYLPPGAAATREPGEWTTEPVAEWSGPLDDGELVRLAIKAGSKPTAAEVFGGAARASFGVLWHAEADSLARVWPGNSPGGYDASHVDMALANHLAFWTGKNCERMERLMRQSALVREKWDSPSHRGYLQTTILKACAYVTSVATGRRAAQTPPATNLTATPVTIGASDTPSGVRGLYLLPSMQVSIFAGLTYVSSLNKIFDARSGQLLPKAAFDVEYGGHQFVLDPMGTKTTDSAWEAFTLSQVNQPPIVSRTCFRPYLDPGAIAMLGAAKAVNTFIPYDCPTSVGPTDKFHDWLRRLIPNDTDRAALLHYLAWITQNNLKAQWWPVIQGTKGNGKSLLIRLMIFIKGEHYCHVPDMTAKAKSNSDFNAYIARSLFLGLEEVALAHRREQMQQMLALVTNDKIKIEGKGVDEVMGDNFCNGIICTNPKDGVPIDASERRYAFFHTAQQCAPDIIRDGMGGTYFPDLYDWFYGREEYAEHGANWGARCIAHELKTMVIGALPHRAPVTASTADAISESLGRAEQEVLEAIEEGRPGFAGGWVSSHYLDILLDRIRANVPRNKRRALMQSLGYDWHPSLVMGRVNEVVSPDQAKPKLYLRAGHLALNLTAPADIGRAYGRAQAVDGAVKSA